MSAATEDPIMIIAIDDDPLCLDAIEMYLSLHKITIIKCLDAEDIYNRIPTINCGVDLLITDGNLYGNVKYETIISALRLKMGNIPAIVLTGDTSATARERAVAAGCYYISKPVSPQILEGVINALTKRWPPENSGS